MVNPFMIIDQYRDGLNLYEYVKNGPMTLMDSIGLATDFDLDALWELVKLFKGKDKSKCSVIYADFNKFVLNEIGATGFCPPFTDLILGWDLVRAYAEDKIREKLPAYKYNGCEFPCICDLRKGGWDIHISDFTFTHPDVSLTLFWGVGPS